MHNDSAAPIPELDRRGLRHFGLTTGAIVAVLFGGFFPWLLEGAYPLWPWCVLGLLAVWALVAPESLRGLYRGWMRVGLLLGRITTPLVMGAIFFLLIFPIAMIMTAVKNDPMRRRLDRSVDSYRIKSTQPAADNLEKPF